MSRISGISISAETHLLSIIIAAVIFVLIGFDAQADTKKPIVGIAWRDNIQGVSYKGTIAAFREAGAETVLLDQIVYADFKYDDSGRVLDKYTDPCGMLSVKYARKLRTDYRNSNVKEVLSKHRYDLIVLPGGEDISPSLMRIPEESANKGEEYNASRDISDFILASYCLEKNIKIMGICRGMQMLAAASGAQMIQDLGDYYASEGIEYEFNHRMPADAEDRDFTAHDIIIENRNTRLSALTGCMLIKNAPSWHHQAVKSAENTNLIISAVSNAGGLCIIEGIERTDKAFAVGIQYHPEIIISKTLDNDKRSACYTDYEFTLQFFKNILAEVIK